MQEAREVAKLNGERVEEGVSLCNLTSAKLKSVEQSSRAILETNEHMMRSYEEQSAAIRQASGKLQDISQSTQVSSDSAEASSQSSQTLAAQGQSLLEVIGELASLVEGHNAKAGGGRL